MPTRLEQLEHDGELEVGLTAPTVRILQKDENAGLTDEQIRLKNIKLNPSESRRAMLAASGRPEGEPWLNVNNPLVWDGEQDDD